MGLIGLPACASLANAALRFWQTARVTRSALAASMPRVLVSTKKSGDSSVNAARSVASSQRVSNKQP